MACPRAWPALCMLWGNSWGAAVCEPHDSSHALSGLASLTANELACYVGDSGKARNGDLKALV